MTPRKNVPQDFVGEKFGRLSVLAEAGRGKWGEVRWRCVCDCGKEVVIAKQSATQGKTRSCGCLWLESMAEVGRKLSERSGLPQNLCGMRFGRLLVIEFSHKNKNGSYWKCKCDCGRKSKVNKYNLLSGNTVSCGCLLQEVISMPRKHGYGSKKTRNRTYRVWMNMRNRCNCSTNPDWGYYGGRGISVCAAWSDYAQFLADMGECPPNKSIDRFPNNEGNYELGNCRWATPREQRLNQRRRTHCPQGHQYDGGVDYRGKQICRICRNVSQCERRKQAKLEVLNAQA